MEVMAKIIEGRYLDSVKLMLISKSLRELPGISDAVAILATRENREILAATDMLIAEITAAKETDLVVVVKADTTKNAELAVAKAEELISAPAGQGGEAEKTRVLSSTKAALKSLGTADICIISVAGKYAALEAEKALDLGLHVMLFSDNMSVADELKLKQKAISKGLLMMGPDCGTAIINGVPLAFANVVPRGKIGIVSASGTGLQELCVNIAHEDLGISQAFGTGGRDGKQEIGGIMLSACLDYLISDPHTEVIILLAKTPDPGVREVLWRQIGNSTKPVIVNFLKAIPLPDLPQMHYAVTLAETALLACNEYKKLHNLPLNHQSKEISVSLPVVASQRKYIRGLYSGGTLCNEALQMYHNRLGCYPLSNIAAKPEERMQDVWKSEGDCFIDMGSDEFTVGRPHPMIDYSLRLKKLAQEASDKQVAVILLDVVLGFGAHPDPASELVPVLNTIPRGIAVVCHVLGTSEDPQNAVSQAERLAATGAIVFRSHEQAVKYALDVLENAGGEA